MKLTGSIAALVTPFNQGKVDDKALSELVEWHIAEGTSALAVGATTGESPALTVQERFDLLSLAVRVARGRLPIIAGLSSNHTREAILLATSAREAGADAILHATGFYNKPTQSQLIGHFKELDAVSELPILLYNIPSRTGIELSVDTVATLAGLPRVQGIKDSTGNVSRVTEERLRITKPFSFLSGDDATALGYLAHGGMGSISVTANLVPRRYAEFIRAAREGDFLRARELNDRMMALHRALFLEPNPAGIKYALSRQGLCRNELRLPMTPVSEAVQEQIDQAMQALLAG